MSVTLQVSTETWRAIDKRVREKIVNMLRGSVLSARDQAERFRDRKSKHYSEDVAREHDEWERIHDDALAILIGKRVPR